MIKPKQRRARAWGRALPATAQPIFHNLLRLASHHGLVVTPTDRSSFSYNGRGRINLRTRSSPQDVLSTFAHEIAHWLIADDVARQLPEFGLGLAPDGLAWGEMLYPEEGRDAREEIASVLGMLIEIWAGHDPRYTYNLHGWEFQIETKEAPKPMRDRLRVLERLGLAAKPKELIVGSVAELSRHHFSSDHAPRLRRPK